MENSSFLELIKSIFKKKPKDFSEVEEEIKEVLEDFKEEKVLSDFEEKFFLCVFNLKNLEVREIVIPRNVLIGIDVTSSWEKIKNTIIQNPHYYYPVYKKSLDNFIGYTTLKDLIKFFEKGYLKWEEIVKPPLIIPENLSLISALEKLIEKKVNVAFVVDELSELTGIVRIKDILEELLITESKSLTSYIDKEGWLIIPGTFKIKELEKIFNIKIPKEEYETISGFIINNLKRIPQSGEKFKIEPFEVEIVKSDGKKIEIVKLRILK